MVDFGATALNSTLVAFGHDYPYYPPDSEEVAATVTGDFERAAEIVDLGGEVPITSYAPVVTVALAKANTSPEVKKFPESLEPEQGGRFLIDGQFYSILDRNDDGIDGAKLILHEA
ncbi:MAG: hypothetical protein KQI62_02205 [Deltaproteobacteria bacterium]|nr:hypothetical protein [Deltaproteobacteria bacterium]